MKKDDLIELAESGKLKITKFWFNTHFRCGAKTESMDENESYRINAKDFDDFIKLGCKFYNS